MKMVVLEFNELCAPLLQQFMGQGLLPNFKRLYERSTIVTTDAEEAPPALEPWIQWPTVHSGMPYSEHRIFDLGDGILLKQKCLGDVLSDAGVPVGIFGSMNLNYGEVKGYQVPDPWNKVGRTSPATLQPYYDVVARQVRESSRENALGKADIAQLGFYMLRHGLTPSTISLGVRQLAAEVRDANVKWRRASLLDDIQYDLFRHMNAAHKVQFATFFCNSTAHYQHYYWRNMQPEAFSRPAEESEHESLRTAVQFGYQSMDRLIGRAFKDYPNAVIVLCTGLSQQPWSDTEKCTFRPRDFNAFLTFAGIDPATCAVKPVMAEQFHLDFPSSRLRDVAKAGLTDLEIGARPMMYVRDEGDASLFGGCNLETQPPSGTVVTRRSDGATRKFDDLFYMIHGVRSGYHHPRGSLWIGNGRHAVNDEPHSLTDIAPTILQYFGVPIPAHMRGAPIRLH